MKKAIILLIMIVMLMASSVTAVFANQTLDEVVVDSENQVEQALENQDDTIIVDKTVQGEQKIENEDTERSQNQQEFVTGLMDASSVSPDIEVAKSLTDGIKEVAAFIVQVVSYIIICFLAVKIMLDLCYITIPMTRTFLANGYGGNAQNTGNMPTGGMGMGGMNSFGMGMGGMGMSSMGFGRTGNRGFGNSMMNQGTNMASGNQRNSMLGQIQFVSNAALNAVASESAVGMDGKTVNPFKIYIKDMIVTLIIVPVLIVLAATGTLANLGFLIADVLVDGIQKLGNML